MPAAEVDLDAALVRALLAEQFPDLEALPLDLVANGWDNAVFRLGDDLCVRLPRRQAAAPLVEHEQRWLPSLAPTLPLPIPAPVRSGGPSRTEGFPWAWSVCPWLPGRIALEAPPADAVEAAVVLGHFVAALHRPAPADAPPNPYRGVPLSDRTERLLQAVARLGDAVDGAAIVERWEALVVTPPWSGPPLWLHGDLHAANVLVDGGRVSAVIDFGDVTAGDPATDLALAWLLFGDDDGARRAFRHAAGDVDDDTWRRAEGWALALGLAFLANSADNPAFAGLGRRTIDVVLRDTRQP